MTVVFPSVSFLTRYDLLDSLVTITLFTSLFNIYSFVNYIIHVQRALMTMAAQVYLLIQLADIYEDLILLSEFSQPLKNICLLRRIHM